MINKHVMAIFVFSIFKSESFFGVYCCKKGYHNCSYKHWKSCYSFDEKINYIGKSNAGHHEGGLAKYKNNLIAVGGSEWSTSTRTDLTELIERKKNGTFIWSVVETLDFINIADILDKFSLVTIPASKIDEEFVLLIGGTLKTYKKSSPTKSLYYDDVLKFNGTWSHFGKLNKSRYRHNSIYWNGAVYVIGGKYHTGQRSSFFNKDFTFLDETKTKMEIWKIRDSPDKFMTSENWPELNEWLSPHLFIVPDSFFPDYNRPKMAPKTAITATAMTSGSAVVTTTNQMQNKNVLESKQISRNQASSILTSVDVENKQKYFFENFRRKFYLNCREWCSSILSDEFTDDYVSCRYAPRHSLYQG